MKTVYMDEADDRTVLVTKNDPLMYEDENHSNTPSLHYINDNIQSVSNSTKSSNLLDLLYPSILTLCQSIGKQDISAFDLKEELKEKLEHFKIRSSECGFESKICEDAVYISSTVFDELIVEYKNIDDQYVNDSILTYFFNESYGGERFFEISKTYLDSKRSFDFIKLIFIYLTIGFRGKYRVDIEGLHEFEYLYNRLRSYLLSQQYEYEGVSTGLSKNNLEKIPRFTNSSILVYIMSLFFVTVITFVAFDYIVGKEAIGILDSLEKYIGF